MGPQNPAAANFPPAATASGHETDVLRRNTLEMPDPGGLSRIGNSTILGYFCDAVGGGREGKEPEGDKEEVRNLQCPQYFTAGAMHFMRLPALDTQIVLSEP